MNGSIRGVSGLLRRLQDDGQDLAAIHATAEGFLDQHYDVPYELCLVLAALVECSADMLTAEDIRDAITSDPRWGNAADRSRLVAQLRELASDVYSSTREDALAILSALGTPD
ncbi:hypothetical protein ACFXO9_29765 [Nocardia tengchongensis]|uniref:hypothetical protein n=1 Tax=Nocardia tengchongensis TaxID=2055889 RepID=UPI003677432C